MRRIIAAQVHALAASACKNAIAEMARAGIMLANSPKLLQPEGII